MRFVIAVLLLAACSDHEPHQPARGSFTWLENNGWRTSSPSVMHDEKRGVTCWMVYQGISCLPDKELRK